MYTCVCVCPAFVCVCVYNKKDIHIFVAYFYTTCKKRTKSQRRTQFLHCFILNSRKYVRNQEIIYLKIVNS